MSVGPRLPSVFSDHMVLQCDAAIPVWGWGEPGTEISVTLGEDQATATVDESGSWIAHLPKRSASFDPLVLKVTAGGQTCFFSDVLVGEVWVCSGQSNMEWPVKQLLDSDIETLCADYPGIRLFYVERKPSDEPLSDTNGRWQIATPETIPDITGTGYFFGRDLHRALNVPVGLIDTSVCGTPIISWMRKERILATPAFADAYASWQEALKAPSDAYIQWRKDYRAFLETSEFEAARDPEMTAETHAFYTDDFDPSLWLAVSIPNLSNAILRRDAGAYWLRRSFDCDSLGAATLHLGPIGDSVSVWINGDSLGTDDGRDCQPIEVNVPTGTLRSGSNSITLRIFCDFDHGGFIGDDAYPYLEFDGFELSLTGIWRKKVEASIAPELPYDKQIKRFGAPAEPKNHRGSSRPACLGNGMVSPVTPYGARGTVWYQGEADCSWRPQDYRQKLAALFADWRDWFQNPDMAFGVVQLANFLAPENPLKDDNWPHLREAQRRAVLDDENAGLINAIDSGEDDDIHPRNKQIIGRRLARWALADVYRKIDLRGGPEPVEISFEEGVAKIIFSQIGTGLKILNGGSLKGFILAGEDRVFAEAEAKIEGDTVVVSAEEVPEPVAVRYAWHLNPLWANLSNEERLPAIPFKSDDWNKSESS